MRAGDAGMVLRLFDILTRVWRVIRGCWPVVGLELRIISRQRRTYALRMGYVALLTVVAGMVWISAVGRLSNVSLMYQAAFLPIAAADIVEAVLTCLFFGGQIGAVITMTGAFSRELRGGGFSALRGTPLTFGQIVLGRFIGRMAQLTVLLLSALPVLALIRVFGGVPWQLVFGGMAVVLGAAACAGAGALHNAARLRTGWPALRGSVRAAALYCVPGLCWLFIYRGPGQVGLWWIPAGIYAVLLAVVLARAVGAFRYHVIHGQPYDPEKLPRLARDPYVYLPRVPDEPGGVLVRVEPRYADLVDDDFSRSKRIEGSPITWRALRGDRLQWSRSAVYLLVIICTGLPVMWWLSGQASVSACSFLLVVVDLSLMCAVAALLSASAITSERRSRCLELLLTTPLTERQIIMGKVRAIIVRILVGIFLVGGCLTSLTLLGQMHVVGVLAVLALCVATLMFVIGLGLYVSARCRTSVAAMALTVGLLAFLWVLMPWLAGSVVFSTGAVSAEDWQWWAGAEWLKPVVSVWYLTRLAVEWAPLSSRGHPGDASGGLLAMSLSGIATASLYAGAGMLLAWRAMRQIRRRGA